MSKRDYNHEPLCETSEKGEKLISKDETLNTALDIGGRLLEVFGYQKISNIIFKLKSNPQEINAVLNGEALPSTELLLGIQKVTGVSIDWLLTGQGARYPIPIQFSERNYDPLPSAMWFINQSDEGKRSEIASR